MANWMRDIHDDHVLAKVLMAEVADLAPPPAPDVYTLVRQEHETIAESFSGKRRKRKGRGRHKATRWVG